MRCDGCQKPIQAGEEYRHQGQRLYAECCLEARVTRPRKTHWQYLGAIRTGYLQEEEKKKEG